MKYECASDFSCNFLPSLTSNDSKKKQGGFYNPEQYYEICAEAEAKRRKFKKFKEQGEGQDSSPSQKRKLEEHINIIELF